MISVLIPVFNTTINKLVDALIKQLYELQIPGEIVIIDDASLDDFKLQNRRVANIQKVSYFELEKNIGRLEIRKSLAEKAQYEWLLYLDSDSEVIGKDFLKSYMKAMSAGQDVIVGGRVYNEERPEKCSQVLHCKYGKQREKMFGRKTAFMTNNFCIKKSVFKKLPDNLSWTGYGHEDTLIGLELEKLEAKIIPINNPVLHGVIEDAEEFMSKSEEALSHLKLLSQYYDHETLRRHVKLFDWYCRLKAFNLTGIVTSLYNINQNKIHINLSSCNPSLKLFDWYRMAKFIDLMRNSRMVKVD